MCGLFAYFDPADQPDLPFDPGRVIAALRRRGPDGFGTLRLQNCSLIHTRLAILDVDHGHQPMIHAPSGVAIAYNGEVYNANELREALISEGYVFRTATDSEVVLAAYVEYGADCVSKFEGMFAFAIWDPRLRCVFVARDRLGEKPLYFARLQSGAIMVASEIKALIAAGLEPTINFRAINHYLQWKYTPVDQTIYNEIEIVPPAHCITFSAARETCNRYWRIPPSHSVRISAAQAVDELHHRLLVSVGRRLQSDRNCGVFLSGGIDSTLLARLAVAQSGRQLASFTAAYDGELDESARAAMIAARLGTDHWTVPVHRFTPDDLEAVCAYFDQPHADCANVAQSLLTKCASEHLPVVLSGDGADELFCGYRWYGHQAGLANRNHQMTIFPAALRRKLFPDIVEAQHEATEMSSDSFDALNVFDLSHYLSGQLLPKADLIGMSYGVEIRSPFLDHRIVEFARSLPPEVKIGNGNKPLLRDLHHRIFPDLAPPIEKQGFGPPLCEYLAEPRFRAYVLDRLGKGARIREFLDGQEVEQQIEPLLANHLDRRCAYRIWTLLVLELWAANLRPISGRINRGHKGRMA